ncbi:MAG: hypothetical protein R3B11_18300 [Nitrospira sp.]|nr:hypothetical protein [Nitrospira sp.]MCW5787683.1 hypothetical protein [Nitrospira sp.]MDR4474057.1 hypothetical protein [Nitrospira sp.]MDR4477941.1 hypothetical protein [Nitrospira sp.]
MTQLTTIATTLLLAAFALPVAADTGTTLNQVIKDGTARYYDDPQELTLAAGFWAQAGSDVTATIHHQQGYYVDKSPLDEKDKQYTSNAGRTFVVAGCVPKNLPIKGPVGSVWVACNDLDYLKDKVVESRFISCLDLFPNGVVSGLSIKEVNNRTWESFRFSCRDIAPDGGMIGTAQKSDFLFNFEREGKLYEATAASQHLTFGIFEVANALTGRKSLLQIALEHTGAATIQAAGTRARPVDDFTLSEKIPDAFGLGGMLRVDHWTCPPGMVLTGMAIGHNPDKKGNDTRPIYILGECRKLLYTQ